MKKSGRQSASSLSVVAVELPQRIGPPDYLTGYQLEVWRSTVESKPIDWFGEESKPLLIAYCKACDLCRIIAEQIDSFDIEWLKDEEGLRRYERLCSLHDKQTRVMGIVASKMRITQQSRYTPQAASTASSRAVAGCRPWEKK